MKKKNFLRFPVLIGSFMIAAIVFVACSKQRITQDTYSPMDSFYNKNQPQEQEMQVDSGCATPPCPCKLTYKLGTSLVNVCDKSMFVRKKDGSSIYYPYKVRLTEVYSVKDIILCRVPTVAGGTILESEAELRVRAFKDADELNFVSGNHYGIAVAPIKPMMSGTNRPFYGIQTTGVIDWAWSGIAGDTIVPDPATGTVNFIVAGKIDWVQSARPLPTASAYTKLKVIAVGNNTDAIDIYIVFKNTRSVMKVNKLESGDVPVGANVTFIAMALNQNNDYLLDKQDITVTAGQQITLGLSTVSEASLLSTLGGL